VSVILTRRRCRTGILAVWLGAWCMGAAALSSDATSPIDLNADAVEIDDGQHTSTYTGKVEVRQGTMRLWADKVVMQHLPSRQPSRITATGAPVRYRQKMDDGQEMKAESQRMEYDATSEEILLIDRARLTQGQDSFSSDRILYDRNKAVVKAGASAQGHKRVHISIVPKHK
jgi:lipopolysaccharide export system protein LptA